MSRDSDTSPNFSMSGSRSQDEKEAANMLGTLFFFFPSSNLKVIRKCLFNDGKFLYSLLKKMLFFI